MEYYLDLFYGRQEGGDWLVDSVANRDLAVVQVAILIIAISMVTANLIVDLAYGWLDPRVRDLRTETNKT